MDRFTIRNLELFYSPNEGAITLIDVLDDTKSAMGGRMLRRWLALPLKDEKHISKIVTIERNNNNLIIIDGTYIFTNENYIKLIEKIAKHFKNYDTLSIKEFKEISQTTRKYAVPLLEYLDKNKITYRLGNERKEYK